MRLAKSFLFLVLITLLTGCSQKNLNLTYNSDPSGAMLYDGEKSIGYTPITVSYILSKEDINRGHFILKEKNVRWVSGATKFAETIKINLSNGFQQEYNFVRPKDAPDKNLDTQFAAELIKARIMQQQVDAQKLSYEKQHRLQQEQIQLLKHKQENQLMQPFQHNSRQHCTSRMVGNQIYTDCY